MTNPPKHRNDVLLRRCVLLASFAAVGCDEASATTAPPAVSAGAAGASASAPPPAAPSNPTPHATTGPAAPSTTPPPDTTPANSSPAAMSGPSTPVVPAASSGGATPSPTPGASPTNTAPILTAPQPFGSDAGNGWQTLINGAWKVPPGEETYHCVRFTIPEPVSINAFRAVSPAGTHHTLLTLVDNPTAPDGGAACNAGTNGTRSITGSGVGTNEWSLPSGVVMQLKPGTQLLLNLHLFNVTDKPIEGVSGMHMKLIPAADVKHLAEGILAGPVSLNIPVGGPTKVSGTCTMSHDVTLFAVSPHMHQLGIHLKAVAHSSIAGDVVLSDAPYDFEEQVVLSLPQEVPMKMGDEISVECTYQNTTDEPVMFGESSTSEMCFTGVYRYPAGSTSFSCFR